MERIGVRPRLPPARHRAFEHASSTVAAVRSGGMSLRRPAQMPGLQPHASGAPMRLKLREQIVSATSKLAQSPYSLCDGVSFTGLPFNGEVARLLAAIR